MSAQGGEECREPPSALECLAGGIIGVGTSAIEAAEKARAEGREDEADMLEGALALLGLTMSASANAEIKGEVQRQIDEKRGRLKAELASLSKEQSD